jgi:hypothetical protein
MGSAAVASAFEREPSLVQENALGTIYETTDGRRYRYARVGAAPITFGGLIVCPDVTDAYNARGIVAVTAPRGTSQVVVSHSALPAGTKPANLFAGGLYISSAGPGLGYAYRINQHSAFTNAINGVFQLDESLIEDLVANNSYCNFVPSSYGSVGVYDNNPTGGGPVGVAIAPMPALSFGWFQTRGLGMIKAGAVVITAHTTLYPISGGSVDIAVTTQPPVGFSLTNVDANSMIPAYVRIE